MATPPTENIFWHPSAVTPADRERLLGQKGCVLWFTGLSGSGKSTLAQAVERALIDQGHLAYILDGDNVRHGLNAGLGFTVEDRHENLRRIAEVSSLFAHSGVICLTAFISPLRENRARARAIIGAERFLEVHVATDLAECERRDTKGLYEKARAGDVQNFTGISSPYEPPEDPDIRIETQDRSVEEGVAQVVRILTERGILT
jgi:adenylylsulfate kinase